VGLGGELIREHPGFLDAVDAELADGVLLALVGVEAVRPLGVGDSDGFDDPPAQGVRVQAVVEDLQPLVAVGGASEGVHDLGALRRVARRVEGELYPAAIGELERAFRYGRAQLGGGGVEVLPVDRIPRSEGLQHAQGGQSFVVVEVQADRGTYQLVATVCAVDIQSLLPHPRDPTPHRTTFSPDTGIRQNLHQTPLRNRALRERLHQDTGTTNRLRLIPHRTPLFANPCYER